MSNERVLESLKNTRMCKFITSGRCCRGSTCNFAHSLEQLKPMPNLVGTRLCAQFSATGRCRYGKACKFAHGFAELKDVPVDNESTATRPPDVETESVTGRSVTGMSTAGMSVTSRGDGGMFTEPPGLSLFGNLPRKSPSAAYTHSEPGGDQPYFDNNRAMAVAAAAAMQRQVFELLK
eukprot:Skav200188  [mRNA]  locus=scaffold2383:117098:120587:+ [translate_table: standard]